MRKIATPQAGDWNHYWSLDQTKRFTKVSWSKRRIINILDKYVCSGKSALDAGCGSGFFSKYFCDAGLTTVALDYSEEALSIAHKITNGQAETVRDDLLDPNLPSRISKRFDVIFSDGLLEHFELAKQNVIMQNFISLLKPDGVIATFVPNKFSPWELIRPLYMPGIEEDPFTLNQLLALNHENQLTVLQQGGINVFPFKLSPDRLCGPLFGMLLFTVAKKS